MKETIKDFENAAMSAVATLREKLGATRVDIDIHVDNYESGCKTDVTFFTSIPADASRVPGCGPACKGD